MTFPEICDSIGLAGGEGESKNIKHQPVNISSRAFGHPGAPRGGPPLAGPVWYSLFVDAYDCVVRAHARLEGSGWEVRNLFSSLPSFYSVCVGGSTIKTKGTCRWFGFDPNM